MNNKGNETTVINCNLTRTDSWKFSLSDPNTLYFLWFSRREEVLKKNRLHHFSRMSSEMFSVREHPQTLRAKQTHRCWKRSVENSHSLCRAPRSGSGERTVDILQYESELQNYFPWSSWCSARSCDSQFMNVSNVWHLLKNYLEQWHMGESLWVIFCENNRTRKRRTSHLL